jgi:hypothetical protein
MPSDSSTPTNSDDIDLDWDDAPSSSPLSTPRSSLHPISVAPRPRSAAPPKLSATKPVRSVAPRAVPSDRLPPTKKASLPPPPSTPREAFRAADLGASSVALPLLPPLSQARPELPIVTSDALDVTAGPGSVGSEWLNAAEDTLRPNQLEARPASSVAMFRGHSPWPALIAVGIVACIGLIWLVVSPTSSAPNTVAELPQARPMAAPSPAPVAHAPAAITAKPRGETTATSVANNDSAGFADSFKAALGDAPANTAATIPVTVRISPPDAFIFKSDRRLGRGSVTVNIAPGTKITLVAQRDGYMPRTLVLDGNYNSVNIVLKRSQASPAATSPSGQRRNIGRL